MIVVAFALAAGGIGLGFAGSQQLAIVATGFLLLPAIGFVFSMLLARMAGPMPGKRPRGRSRPLGPADVAKLGTGATAAAARRSQALRWPRPGSVARTSSP